VAVKQRADKAAQGGPLGLGREQGGARGELGGESGKHIGIVAGARDQ
jgi:hypothetical protein